MDRITERFLEAKAGDPLDGMTPYELWLDNNPALARITTITPTLMRRLRMELRLNAFPNAAKFFQLADQIHHMGLGAPVEDVSQEFRVAGRYLSQAVLASKLGDTLGSEIANAIMDCVTDNAPNLRRIGAGATGQLFTKVGSAIALVVEKLANSLGLGAGSQIKTVEGVRWPTVRLLSKKEKALADLQQNNPEMYDEVTGNLEKVEQAQETVKKEIIDAGLVPTTVLVDSVPVPAGEDYATGEKTVHTPDGRVLPEKEFRREVGAKKRQQAHLMSSFATMPMLRPENLQLSGVRKLSDEDLLNPDVIPLQPNGAPQAIVYRALTDDKAAQNKNTRIYPTMLDKDGDPIIVDGRFKGFKLDDMVNAVGRLVEGAAYDLDANGYPVAFETTNADGMLEITANKEPYCTLDSQGRFLIRIPVIPSGRGKKDPYTIARRNMERVSSKKAVIDPKTKEEVKKGRTKGTSILELPVPEGGTPLTLFSFEAKDFATVRTAVGGMVLSASAAKKIREYYSQMARQEEATKKENLKPYSLDRIGGFKSQQVIDPATGEPYDPPVLTKDLQSKQKEALSWIEAKGYKGLAALDTGVGKCVRGDTLIPTNKGLVQIRDLNPGLTESDTQAPVQGWSVLVGGKSVPVAAFYYAGRKPTIKVRTRNGYGIEGSLIHPVLVRRNGKEVFVKLPDIQVGDFLCVERRDGDFPTEEPSLRVPGPDCGRKTYDVPDKMNPDLARLLGYIVSEGWVNHDRMFTICQDGRLNPEVNHDIVSLSRSQMGYRLDPLDNDKQVSSKFLRTYLEWMGVDYTLSADKCIPPVILRSTRASVVQFVRAFVDAECSVCENGLEVSSASERMLRELQVLLLRLGVVSSRRPKQVKGNDHTYWRLQITGDNLRRYRTEVGMVSARKAAMLDILCDRDSNSNSNVIPQAIELVESLRAEIFLRAGGQGKGGGLNKRFGNTFVHTLTHVRHGRRNPTYAFLQRMLSVAKTVGADNTDAFRAVSDYVQLNYFYDPVEAVTSGFTEVMDIMVDDPQHMFVGDGVVNHNTLLSIATMQKMVRDGAAPEGSRFLYVCPKKLKGNFPRELQAWMTEEAAQGLRSRVDIMSYEEFTFKVVGGIRTKKMAVPGTENLEKVLGEDGKPLRGPDGKIVYRPVPGTEKMVSMKTPDGKPIKEKVLPSPDFARQYAAIFFDEAQVLVKNENSAVSRAAQTLNHPRKVLLTASPMEDDPDELYVGVAITNNVVVASTGRGKLSQERKDLMAFRRRFCVRVAGRTVGIKSDSDKDPTARQDFDAWAKSGMYFADKRTVGTDEGVSDYEKGLKLTTLHKQALSLTMDPEVELEYKAAAKGVMKVLKGLVSVYRDKTLPPAAVRAQVESFQKALKDYMGTLNALANYPDEVVDPKTGKKKFPGAVSSKVAGATWLVSEKITNGKRTLLFTDDPKFAVKTVEQMSANLPNMRVAVALSDKVVIYVNGKPQEGKENVFTQRQYKYTDENGKTAIVPKDEWASYVLRSIIGGDPTVKALVLTKSYALGQNLQMFSTVVHLDRDTFSNETMKQRTARAWRTGQKDPVEEYTMDAVFDAKTETSDPTLDEVRKYIQESQENVFNEIVHKSKEAIIGQEWKGMQDTPASMVAVNRKLFELALGPYPAALGDEDYDRSVQNQ